MREDGFSRDEAGAANHATILGAHEHIGDGPGDQEPDPARSQHLGPDPWTPYTCPRCGDDDKHGMPQRCPMCGWVNYGGDAA